MTTKRRIRGVISIVAMLLLLGATLGCSDEDGGGKCVAPPEHVCSWEDNFDQAQCPSMGSFDQCVVYVDQDVECSKSGNSWANAKQTVQEGVDAAACGVLTTSMCPVWQVWIKGGTHRINQGCLEDTVFLRSDVELYGGFAGTEETLTERDLVANPTVLDGAGEGEVANVNNVLVGLRIDGVLVDGLTVRGGSAFVEVYLEESGDQLYGGGGLLFSDGSFEVHNCTFEDNTAGYGAAISLWTSEATISGSSFTGNHADHRGGAIFSNTGSGPFIIEDCTFTGNTVKEFGGAVRVDVGPAEIRNSEFVDNHAFDPEGAEDMNSQGGAVLFSGATATIDNCTFTGNTANWDGGGVRIGDSEVTVSNSSFTDNETVCGMAGGGLSIAWGTATVESCTFTGNRVETDQPEDVFRGQSGGLELFEVEAATVSDCVFEDNVVTYDGGAVGVYVCGDVLFERCVFYNNSSDRGGGIALEQLPEFPAGTTTIDHCTFAGNDVATTASDIMVEDAFGTLTVEVTNSILWSDAQPIDFAPAEAAPIVTYSDVCSGCDGTGNIDADPLFVDEAGGDLHLAEGSPCIGTGEGGSDMGAYPYE